jgi:hypothetical protein
VVPVKGKSLQLQGHLAGLLVVCHSPPPRDACNGCFFLLLWLEIALKNRLSMSKSSGVSAV